tara:strand:+ start:163 stop:315 length:153 start_codon:yes stop_codon:yes gene_type:complete
MVDGTKKWPIFNFVLNQGVSILGGVSPVFLQAGVHRAILPSESGLGGASV